MVGDDPAALPPAIEFVRYADETPTSAQRSSGSLREPFNPHLFHDHSLHLLHERVEIFVTLDPRRFNRW
jgi:hypothetical protein